MTNALAYFWLVGGEEIKVLLDWQRKERIYKKEKLEIKD
jgi:hypothetical protein